MKVHLCVNFDPSTNREGPVVFLVEGNWVISHNAKHPGVSVVLGDPDPDVPLEVFNEGCMIKSKGQAIQVRFPENYPQRSVTIVAEKQNATEHGST